MQDPMEVQPVTEVAMTQVAQPPVYAWSQEDSGQWRTPTVEYRTRSGWPRLVGGGVKYLAPAAIAVGALGFTLTNGHHSDSRPTPAPPTTVTRSMADPAPPPNASRDDQFIQLLVESGQSISDRTKAVAGGHWVCSYLGLGHTRQDVVKMWDAEPQPGLSQYEAHKADRDYVDAAVKAYCPELP